MAIIATVIGLVILLLRKVISKKLSPKCTYIIWLVFVLALIYPISVPSKISVYNYIDVENIKEAETEYSNNMLSVKSESIESKDKQDLLLEIRDKITSNNYKMYNKYLMFIISDIWFIICLINLSKTIYKYVGLNRIIGNYEIQDERMVRILERCKSKLKIKRNIKLIAEDFMDEPYTTGLINIRIFIPATIFELDDICVTDIMMHELSHYKRKDHLLNTFIIIAKCVYFFDPIIKYLFEYMKTDMELATDEMAIENLEEDEKAEYCKVIIKVADIGSQKFEALLGLSDDAKILERRIDMVFMKEIFEKHARLIMASTISIVLLMWLIFYPSCYGIFGVPKLYLELEDGSIIATAKIDNENESKLKTISVNKSENLKLVVQDGECEDYVTIKIVDLVNMKTYSRALDIKSHEIWSSQEGEYLYKFTLKYGNNKSVDYGIKIIVE